MNIVLDDNAYYFKCDFEKSYWRFQLIKELEFFYGKVLDSIVVHGSCVRYLEKNILFLGTRWSGKTTLTQYLTMEKNASYIDDDCVYICRNIIIGFSMPLPIRDPNVCSNHLSFLGMTVDTDGIERTLFLPPKHLNTISHIDVIFFPTFKKFGENSVNVVDSDIVFKKIISNVRSHNNIYNLFKVCGHLARNCRCFELRYTSSENACNLIEREL